MRKLNQAGHEQSGWTIQAVRTSVRYRSISPQIGRVHLAAVFVPVRSWCRAGKPLRMDAESRQIEAAKRTASLSRNCPGAAEIAGKPPAVGSATPGVGRKNVRVTRKVQADIAAPSAEAIGLNDPAINAAAVASSSTPNR